MKSKATIAHAQLDKCRGSGAEKLEGFISMTSSIKRGGKRPGSGRKKGIPNKNTFELKQAAAKHGEEALSALISVIRNEETPPNVIVSACREVLDRGFGRPAITIDPQEINLNVFPPREVLDGVYAKALEEAAKRDQILIGRRERLGIMIDRD
ncbi:MAG: hypothetical protein ACXWT3_08080 [Methylococcaceae bacterium]